MHRGQLSMNRSAYEALGSPEAVELLYSRKDRRIGIRPVDPGVPHAYKPHTATKDKGRGPYIVSGAAFMTYFNIQQEQTTRYTATLEGNILSISLKEGGTPLSTRTGRANRNGAAGSV
jgi:hypothetical protein